MGSIGRVVAEIAGDLPRQVRGLAIVVPAMCLLTAAVLLAVAWQNRVPAQFLVRDPSQTAQYPPYLGLISYLGVLAWCAAAAIGLFAGAIGRDRALRALLLAGGSLSAVLGIDDLWTLHEYVFPAYLGIAEKVVLLTYGLLLAMFLLGFAVIILRRTDFLIIGLALGFFAASEIFDQGFLNQGQNFLLDDGLKLFGIIMWATYVIRTSAQSLRQPAHAVALATPAPVDAAGADPPMAVAGRRPAGGATHEQ
ncbi:MAG: hypothetical protein IT340_03285 [Chloroflexi bacterium]|nr:hypothetical protein [Chloroflexota bacterium]